MNLKTARLFLTLCIILFVGIGIWIGMRNLSYFDIETIETSCTGPINVLSDDMVRIISPYKGVNIFKAELGHLRHSLIQFEEVKDVTIEKFFPDRLIISVDYYSYKARVSFEENSQKYYFLTEGDKLIEVTEKTFNRFSSLPEVSLNPSYAYLILKWGADNGFIQMCNLAEELARKNLNTYIKYDNNYTSNFGLLTVEFDNPKAVLCVREPVTPQRLSDSIDLILREVDSSENPVRFDLYSTALVKRK